MRSLGRRGVPVIAITSSPYEHARRSRHARARVVAPDPDRHANDFVAMLLSLADEFGEGVLIPTTDESVGAVAAHADELGRRHLLACPPGDVARRFLDKQLTYDLAADIGVPAPRSTLPSSERDLERCMREVSLPCLVKPRESYRYMRAFGVKMTMVEDAAELRSAWRRARAADVETMVQELIPGPETGGVNYNAYFADGEPVAELTARKVRLVPRDFGYPSAVLSTGAPEVVEPARAIVRGLGLNGFANVEFKRDPRDGTYKLLEVNGRPNMSGWLSVRCGVDFPWMTYRHLVDRELPGRHRAKEGVYWVNEASDPVALVGRWREGDRSLRAQLRPYVHRHVFAWLSLRDPLPFLARAGLKLPAARRRARVVRARR